MSDMINHEFRPLPDKPSEEQVKTMTEVIHKISETAFELRLEVNELREQNESLRSQVEYYRSIVGPEAVQRFNNQSKN